MLKIQYLKNIWDFDHGLRANNSEEARVVIVLYCFQIAKMNLFREVAIFCSDTDVLVMLVYQ